VSLLRAYRITRREFASSIWSGVGARDYGGRWNSPGVAIVYAAESRSLAALEQLVHLIKPAVLRSFVVASVDFDPSRVTRIDPAALPRDWASPVAPAALKRVGDDWSRSGRTPVIAVPSAVISGEWNYLLNPAHPEFPRLHRSDPEPFAFDPRLV
jgi:RES domain-containing protein